LPSDRLGQNRFLANANLYLDMFLEQIGEPKAAKAPTFGTLTVP